MNNRITKHLQNIIVPREHFNTAQQAARHIEFMGFQPNHQPTHISHNYYKFNQYTPKVGENYKHAEQGSDAIIRLQGNQSGIVHPEKHRLGENGHGQLHVYKPPHHNLDEIAASHKLSIYHPSHHNKMQTKGAKHLYHSKLPFDAKRDFDITTRHKAQQKQDAMRQTNKQKKQLQDLRSPLY